MSEPSCSLPKPFSTVRYLFFTTFWAFLLPGTAINCLPILLTAGIEIHWPALVALAVCALLLFGGIVFLKRLTANLRTGQVPNSFTVRILPFWVPLFWGLSMSAVAFYVAPVSFPGHQSYVAVGFLQYLVPVVIAIALASDIETCVIAGSVINFLIAVAGTIYVVRLTPTDNPVAARCCAPGFHSVRQSPTVAICLCLVITLLLGGLTNLSYKRFRMEILPPTWGRAVIPDESGGHFGSDTDLTKYEPFKENNKLVKIESPTLVIDSEHPKISGAFALYTENGMKLYLCVPCVSFANFAVHPLFTARYARDFAKDAKKKAPICTR